MTVVLCYHNIDPSGDVSGHLGHPLERFEEHLDLLVRHGYRTITARQALEVCEGTRRPHRREVVLTFDDCHISQWLYVAPLLAARGMTGTFFAVTDFVWDGPVRTRESVPEIKTASEAFRRAIADGDCSQFLTRAEARALVRDLGMEVYSHSSRHQPCFPNLRPKGMWAPDAHWSASAIYDRVDPATPMFRHASAYACNGFWPAAGAGSDGSLRMVRRPDHERAAFCRRDFSVSLARIRELNEADRQLFCWPWGEHDALSRAVLREVGFAGAFGLDRGPLVAGTDPFRIFRIRVGLRKTAGWLHRRLAVYSSATGASLFARTRRGPKDIARVLYVTDSTHLSGGSRQLLNNAAAMVQSGLDVVVAAPASSGLSEAIGQTGATAVEWPEPRRLLASARFLRRLADERRVDVVHTFHNRAIKAAVLAKLAGGRFGLYLNRGVLYRPNPLIGFFAAVADGVVCNSRAAADRLRPYLVPARKRNLIHNSVTGPFPDSPAAANVPPRVVYIGNANRTKGPDVFLRTAALYHARHAGAPADFVAYGFDRHVRPAWGVPEELLDHVDCRGAVPHAAVLQALSEADVFVLTSRLESMPNVVLEAFAAALPVVCTAVGGVEELVVHGVNGWVCPPDDVDALVEHIRTLVQDPALRRTMGLANRRVAVTHLTNDRKAMLLLRLYSGGHVLDTIAVGRTGA